MKFFTWKKVIIIMLLSRLTYIPCEINSQNTNPTHEPTPDFTGFSPKNSKSIKKEKMGWRGFHKSISTFEGWGGSPDYIDEGKDLSELNPKEYYYLHVKARASAKAVEKDSIALMMASCQDSARANGVDSTFRLFMQAVLDSDSPEEKRGNITYNNTARATHYSCKYGLNENKKLETKECKGFIKDHGIAACWPTGENLSWSTCDCLTYIKVPGGKNALRNMISYD